MLKLVISGGQTGADMSGLIAARHVGLKTSGWAPKGWRTETGCNPELQGYGLKEHASSDYPPRTKRNIQSSDMTLIIADHPLSGGSALARELCFQLKKPVFSITLGDLEEKEDDTGFKEIVRWIKARPHTIINIAGSRASKVPEMEKLAVPFLVRLFQKLK